MIKKTLFTILAITTTFTTFTATTASAEIESVYEIEYAKCMKYYSQRKGRTGRFLLEGAFSLFGATTPGQDRLHARCDNYAINIAVNVGL